MVFVAGVLYYNENSYIFDMGGMSMNALDHFLLTTRHDAGQEKTAFDQTLRNLGVDLVGKGGKVLSKFENNPMVASAVLGAGMGGAQGAMSAREHGESKTRRGLRHALYGAVGGGAAGGVFSGATRNIGRYGSDIADSADAIRQGKHRKADPGQFGDLMRETVFSGKSARGGKKLEAQRARLDAAREAANNDNPTVDQIKAVKDAKSDLNKAGGGLGTRFNPLAALGIIGAGTAAGVKGREMYEKNSSLRIRNVLDKQASFGALAAKAVGMGAQGAGKAIQMGAANPALAGAAVGAAGGAVAGGEGNRLKGALGGAVFGAGAGAGLAKLAPQATANMGQFGKALQGAGKGVVTKAGKEGATFAGSMEGVKTKLSKDMANFTGANRKLALPSAGGDRAAMGMSGRAAAGTALAGVGAAGLAGGAATRSTPENQAKADRARQRFSNVAMM